MLDPATVGSLPLAKNAMHSPSSIIGERERANLVVRTARFFRYIYIYITGAAYVVSNSTLHAHAHAHVKLQSPHRQAS